MNRPFLLSLAASSLAFAQVQVPPSPAPAPAVPQTLAGVVRLNRVPVSDEVLKFKLPRPVEKTLDNGAHLLVLETHRSPTVTFRMSLPAGSLRDPEGVPGVADATAAIIRLGTKTRKAQEITDALADLGAQLTISSNQEEAAISLSALTENFDGALAILADILANPTFPSDEVNRWKQRLFGNLQLAQTQPAFLANDTLSKLLYGADARQYTHPDAESLKKISRQMIVDHYTKYYLPSGEWMGVSGDITAADAVAKLNKAFAEWKGGPAAHVSLPTPAPIAEKKVFLVPRTDSVQTLLVFANRAINRKSPDFLDVQVLNRILGGGPTSRLFRVIREQKGFTYGISSSFTTTQTLAHFTASTSVRVEVTGDAIAEILNQFSGIRNQPVPAGELADAKSAIVAGFVLGLESTNGTMLRWMEQRQYGLPEDYWDNFPQNIMAVTAEDVQRVAKKYIPVDNVQIVAVGDPVKIGAELKKFGPVEQVKLPDPDPLGGVR